MPFQFILEFIDGDILKSCRMGLANYTQPKLHHINPLVINALGGGHTDRQTDTHIPTSKQKQFQDTRHVLPKVGTVLTTEGAISTTLHW